MPSIHPENNFPFLQGGGEMGKFTRQYNWAETELGSPHQWPQSLRTTLSIVLNSKFPMFLFWGKDLLCFYNDAYRPSLGNNGKHPWALGKKGEEVWPEIWHIIKPLIDQVLAGGEATWSENQLVPIYRNGKVEDVYWTFSYSPVNDESGKPAGIFVTCTETTQTVLTVKQLEVSNQRFQNFVRQATVGIIVLMGEEMRVGLVNEKYGQLISRKPEELLHQNLFDIIPETEAVFRPIINQVRLTGEPLYLFGKPYFLNINGVRKDGFLDLVYQPYREASGTITGVMVLCHEVTEQVLARQKTEEAEERARLAIESAELGVYELSFLTNMIVTSARFNEIFDVEGISEHGRYVSAIHEGDLLVRELAYQKAFENGILNYTARVVHKNGAIRWIIARGKIYFDADGKPLKILGVVQDITEQKELERQKDNFLGIASHELKTPVTSIKAYAQLLEKVFTRNGDSKSAALLAKMNSQANRLNSLIADLLDVTKINNGKLQFNLTSFDFSQMVEEIIEDMQRTTDKHTIEKNLQFTGNITGDRDRICQVVINLLSNAIKYSPNATEVKVYTERHGNEVQLCIQDFGIGISSEIKDRVFEQFYRVSGNKEHTFPGLGLGLYISSEIVKRMNGRIWVNSTAGKGSTFCFSLPVGDSSDN